MLVTDTIIEFDTGLPGVYGFTITGKVDREAMKAMSERMLAVFAHHEKLDMLLDFATEETSTTGSSLSTEAIEAQAKSLSKVRNYVVSRAPGHAGGLVESMGKVMPVDARSFDTREEALEWLAAQPAPGH